MDIKIQLQISIMARVGYDIIVIGIMYDVYYVYNSIYPGLVFWF